MSELWEATVGSEARSEGNVDERIVVIVFVRSRFEILLDLEEVLLVREGLFVLAFQLVVRIVVTVKVDELRMMG